MHRLQIPSFAFPYARPAILRQAPKMQTSQPPSLPRKTSCSALNDHLKSCRPTRATEPVHIILGNEGADLDSVACALALSYAKTHKTLPIINIKRADLRLRRDVLHALQLVEVDVENLCFIDDPHVHLEDAPVITLVDHNALAPHQMHLSPKITAIFDHHVDENQFRNATPRHIVPSKSCATIITELILPTEHSPLSDSADVDAGVPLSVSLLLLFAILLDSHNMSHPPCGEISSDKAAIEMLLKHAGMSAADRDVLFNQLYSARIDVIGFTALDLMRKDVKMIEIDSTTLAICSIPISFPDLLVRSENELAAAVRDFAAACHVDCVVLMLAYSENTVRIRKLLISEGSIGNILARQLLKNLHHRSYDLQLETAGYVSGLHNFHQRNSKASRKAVIPLLKLCLQNPMQP